jgi:CheY-like chemotaxis protein
LKCEIAENDSATIAREILHNLEDTFGVRVFDALMMEISDNYLGREMDIVSAIKERPDLFDKAFVELLGEPGEKLLAVACRNIGTKFGLDKNAVYSKCGDLARWIELAVSSVRTQSNRRIMIVDDEPDILTVLGLFLEDGGWKVDTFSNASAALAHFRANTDNKNNGYSVVLTDIKMPGISGLDFASEVLKIRPDTKILLMSAFQLDNEMKGRLPLTMYKEMLQKPFQLDQVCDAIKKTMMLETTITTKP